VQKAKEGVTIILVVDDIGSMEQAINSLSLDRQRAEVLRFLQGSGNILILT
jgi:hypothetical protein